MATYCVVNGCRGEYVVSFFGFPFKRPEILEQWIHVLQTQNGNPNWTPYKNAKICSKHFLASDFQERLGTVYKYIGLKPDAVPSVFKITSVQKPVMPPKKIVPKMSGIRCCVCKVNFDSAKDDAPGDRIRFFKFPRSRKLARQWIKVCAKPNDFNYSVKHVCSRHFTEDDYGEKMIDFGYGLRVLNENAIPSLNLPESKTKKKKNPTDDLNENQERKRIKVEDEEEEVFDYLGKPIKVIVKDEPNGETSKVDPQEGEDHHTYELSLEEKVQTLREENFAMSERIEKLEDKVNDLENLLEEFLNSKMESKESK